MSLSAVATGSADDGGDDCDEFVSFLFDGQTHQGLIAALFVEQLKPQLGLVRFLEGNTQFRNEFSVRSGAGSFPNMGCDRGAGAEHLFTADLALFTILRELHEEANDRGRKLFRSCPELLTKPALSHLNSSISAFGFPSFSFSSSSSFTFSFPLSKFQLFFLKPCP